MEKVNNKISYITFLQSFAVTLVVIGHSFPKINGTDTMPLLAKYIHDIIYFFHMPLFFSIAGFLFVNSLIKNDYVINLRVSVKNKLIRLLVPYFSLSTLVYFLKTYIFNGFAYRESAAGLEFFIRSFIFPRENANGGFWFLPTMFFVYVIAYLFYKKFNKENIFMILAVSFLVSILSVFIHTNFLGINEIIYFLFYFSLGMLLFFYKSTFQNKCLLWSIIFIIASSLGLLFYHKMILIKICLATIGIIFSFSFAYYFDTKGCKFLYGIIDGEYYQIYLLAWFSQPLVRIFYQMGKIDYITCSILMFLNAFIFSKIICYMIKNFIPQLSIFIGLKSYNNKENGDFNKK